MIMVSTDTLKELWASELLPERRKLKYLNQRPLDRLSTSSSTGSLTHQQSTLLLLWFFEDQIKSRYVQFINTLQVLRTHFAREHNLLNLVVTCIEFTKCPQCCFPTQPAQMQ